MTVTTAVGAQLLGLTPGAIRAACTKRGRLTPASVAPDGSQTWHVSDLRLYALTRYRHLTGRERCALALCGFFGRYQR